MDKSDIKHFEQLLQKQSFKRPSVLYNKAVIKNEQTYKPQDVIETVYSQIKAIHIADCSTRVKRCKDLNKLKKSNFLAVNKLPVYSEVPKLNPNTFETQCVSDTQLVNIIETVEAIDTHTGMTQEFDKTFAHIEKRNTEDVRHEEEKELSPDIFHNNKRKCKEAPVFEKDTTDFAKTIQTIEKITVNRNNNEVENVMTNLSSEEQNHMISIKGANNTIRLDIIPDMEMQVSNTATDDTTTLIKNVPTTRENNELEDIPQSDYSDDFDSGQCSQRSPSPVFNMKIRNRKPRTPSPLVVSLKTFEIFENFALPVLEHHDLETAKQLINSQILGRELCLNDTEVIYSMDRNYSPILELKNDELQINSQDLKSSSVKEMVTNIVPLNSIENVTEQCINSLKDEILFSSDEENDYIHKELQDIPLTCALETSFYDQANVLEKTMYVGFQTASSKSIQICTDSFDKAQSFLINNEKLTKDFSLTELVEKCDNSNTKFEKSIQTATLAVAARGDIEKYALDTKSNPIQENELGLNTDKEGKKVSDKHQTSSPERNKISSFGDHENERPLEKQRFNGFVTASYKEIKVCDKALENCQFFFKDINLNENFYDNEASEEADTLLVSRSRVDEKKIKNIDTYESTIKNDFLRNGNDNIIDDKINDELLLQEFENIDMSLEDKETNYEVKNVLVEGFKTANNKNINISPKAAAKAKIIFQNIDKVLVEQKIIDTKTSLAKEVSSALRTTSVVSENVLSFKTASNKNVNISAQALAKTKNLFQDIGIDIVNFSEHIKSQGNLKQEVATEKYFNELVVSKNVLVGFKSANNNDIKISEKPLFKSKNMFKNIDNDNGDLELVKALNLPSTTKDVFGGFKTASNKNINISDEALSKCKDVFKDIEKENSDPKKVVYKDQPPMSKSGSAGFKTVANKDTNICNKTLSTSTKDINGDTEVRNPGTEDIQNQLSVDKSVLSRFSGFKTANNVNIKVSEEALSKSKYIFKDIEKEKPGIRSNEDIMQPLTSNPLFESFKTASNKDINISNGALCISKNIFKNIEKETDLHTGRLNKEPGFIECKTATKKNVNISLQAIEKSKKLFQEIEISDNTEAEGTNILQAQNTKNYIGGFKTANDEAVKISQAEPANTKTWLANLETNHDNNTLTYANKDKITTFQTANKKTVIVSLSTLARTKILLQDTEQINDSLPNTNPGIIPSTEFRGFQTGNSIPVEVSKESLIVSKKIFDDLDGNGTENSRNTFVGFKTASNKNVKVSDEALAKSKKILDDLKDIPLNKQNIAKSETKESIFRGFQTGNRQKVDISKEALEKSKKLLCDIDACMKEARSFKGLQTASNKTVNISEQALTKGKQLFLNVENDIKFTNKDTCDKVVQTVEVKSPIIQAFGFKTCNNKKKHVSENALKECTKLFPDTITENIITSDAKSSIKATFDFDLNTQVLNDFEKTLCTENFKDTPKDNKRSGSPILACPRAKRRKKFETPYKVIPKTVLKFDKAIAEEEPTKIIKFKKDYKQNKRYTLKDLDNLEDGENKNINPNILNYNLENILDFEFEGVRNDLTDGKMTIEEIKTLFTDVLDKKLIPEGWLDIHLKLIIWKLISYEVKFPNSLGIVCTGKNVLDQLKYRYDKELYNAERPVLRKILEKDDVPTKAMVLCVAGIYVDGVSVVSASNVTNIELLLTDGWYFVKATIDRMLAKLVHDGKIIVGRKLMISGAELLNCEQGVAPWEDTSSVRLHISGNSTAPAPWDARLGLRPGGRATRLSRLCAGGGKAGRVRLLVVRVYPALYVEKMPDGSTVTRSERLEHVHQARYEAEREALIEKIYEEVQHEFSDQESQESEGSEWQDKRRRLDTGEQIAKTMKTSKDPMDFRAQLTSSQVQLLQEHTSKQRDRYLEAIQSRVRERVTSRHVVTLCRGRVVGLEGRDTVTVTKGMLSIWKPNEEVMEMFKEGSWIEVMNVVPTALRNSEIQLSAGRQSVFRPIKCKNEEIFKPYIQSFKRKCYNIKDLSQNPSMTTDYNEVDTLGIIFLIDPPNRLFESIKNQFQNLYLADVDKNMICVNFWGGIKKFGYENVLDTGQVVYCGNLQKRAGNTRKNVPQYRATEFSMFTRTPKNVNAREMVEETNKKMFGLDRRKFCEDCIAIKQNYSVIECFNSTEKFSPYRFNNSDYNLGRNKMFIETPVGVKVNKPKSDEFSLTGLDFESTFRQQNTQELSPQMLLRKMKVNEKIAKLRMYGEPPPLNHINIRNKSINATNSYKSPLISNNSVASDNNLRNVPTKLPEESARTSDASKHLGNSPIISMNRTYVKRAVNPVKLNFSECVAINDNDNNTVDHFAEEFDGSPPLSLD